MDGCKKKRHSNILLHIITLSSKVLSPPPVTLVKEKKKLEIGPNLVD